MPGWLLQRNLQKRIVDNSRLVATKESTEKHLRQCPAGCNKGIFRKEFSTMPGWLQQRDIQKSILDNARLVSTNESTE